MDKFVSDQAAGLRRLLGQTGFQVITVMSGQQGAGKTAATANLAVALARSGRDVLIVDQAHNGRGATAALGLTPRYDVADVLAGRCPLEALLLAGPDNVQVLPLGGDFNKLGRLSERDQAWLAEAFNRLQCGVDVVLVDMEEATDPDALPLGLAASEIMVVLPPGTAAITQAYTLVKRLAQNFGKRRFRLLLNRMTSTEQAQAVARNFARTAEQYLGVAVDYLGYIPLDERLSRAGHLRTSVVDAFPVAQSTSQFRKLADGLLRWPQPPSLGSVGSVGGFMQRVIQGGRLVEACRRG
ncbi:MinD/ParA family ATP-binding protein [Thiobacillus sedimenti]|uniref:P-loop NTPase n=1 Tax=Thiobacillus sedimenti TaxID=3110231 RepID=A0ABZ1CM76_9PROT|nr:P-loop NTPase [Thiobacillus sp. SCUT-2]WRS40498.1 P-loop NTPase [Thiobacillus sp. SCUT-2]